MNDGCSASALGRPVSRPPAGPLSSSDEPCSVSTLSSPTDGGVPTARRRSRSGATISKLPCRSPRSSAASRARRAAEGGGVAAARARGAIVAGGAAAVGDAAGASAAELSASSSSSRSKPSASSARRTSDCSRSRAAAESGGLDGLGEKSGSPSTSARSRSLELGVRATAGGCGVAGGAAAASSSLSDCARISSSVAAVWLPAPADESSSEDASAMSASSVVRPGSVRVGGLWPSRRMRSAAAAARPREPCVSGAPNLSRGLARPIVARGAQLLDVVARPLLAQIGGFTRVLGPPAVPAAARLRRWLIATLGRPQRPRARRLLGRRARGGLGGVGRLRGSTSLVIDDARAEASTHVAPEDGRGATKTGWCAMRTAVSRERWELEDFHALRLRLRPDGHRYALNLQSEGILGDDIDRGADLFQVHLPVPPTTGEWLELDLPFGLFQLTWRGYVQSAQYAVNRNRLTHVGLIVADGDEGRSRSRLARSARAPRPVLVRPARSARAQRAHGLRRHAMMRT